MLLDAPARFARWRCSQQRRCIEDSFWPWLGLASLGTGSLTSARLLGTVVRLRRDLDDFSAAAPVKGIAASAKVVSSLADLPFVSLSLQAKTRPDGARRHRMTPAKAKTRTCRRICCKEGSSSEPVLTVGALVRRAPGGLRTSASFSLASAPSGRIAEHSAVLSRSVRLGRSLSVPSQLLNSLHQLVTLHTLYGNPRFGCGLRPRALASPEPCTWGGRGEAAAQLYIVKRQSRAGAEGLGPPRESSLQAVGRLCRRAVVILDLLSRPCGGCWVQPPVSSVATRMPGAPLQPPALTAQLFATPPGEAALRASMQRSFTQERSGPPVWRREFAKNTLRQEDERVRPLGSERGGCLTPFALAAGRLASGSDVHCAVAPRRTPLSSSYSATVDRVRGIAACLLPDARLGPAAGLAARNASGLLAPTRLRCHGAAQRALGFLPTSPCAAAGGRVGLTVVSPTACFGYPAQVLAKAS